MMTGARALTLTLEQEREVIAKQFSIALRDDEVNNRLRAETVALEQRLEYRDEEIAHLRKELAMLRTDEAGDVRAGGLSVGLD